MYLLGPKPPKAPQEVKVGPLMSYNGSLSAEITWTPPPSDLPIQKYKIFWSRRLHGATALDSVLVHQHTVSKVIQLVAGVRFQEHVISLSWWA